MNALPSCMPVMSRTLAPQQARSLDAIRADAMLASCDWCWGTYGEPCDTARPGGIHVDRFGRAMKAGLISRADMVAVIDAVCVFESGTVLYPEPGQVAA